MHDDPALRRGQRIQLSLMIVALVVLLPLGGFFETFTIVLISTIVVTGFAMLWTRWLPRQSPKVRQRTAIISVILAVAGVAPMFIFDLSGPIIAPPPFLISFVAGGALLSLVTTPRVSSE